MKYLEEKYRAIESFCDFIESNGATTPVHPLEINLEVSNLCNFKCAMCAPFSKLNPNRHIVLRKEERKFQDFDLDQMQDLLKHSLMVHCFGYGEVTIHPRFYDIIQRLSEYEVLVDFFSNGLELDEKLSRLLVEGRVAKLFVSFSGTTKEQYENIYMGGDFDRVLNNLRTISNIKESLGTTFPRIEINSLGFQHHVDSLPDFVDMMADAGVDAISLKPLQGQDKIPQLHSHIAVYRPEIEGKRIDLAHQRAKERGLRLNTAPWVNGARVEGEGEEARMAAVQRMLGRAGYSDLSIPIEDMNKQAEQVAVIPAKGARPSREIHTALDVAEEQLEAYMNTEEIIPPNGVPCLEPFMRFYIKSNGNVEPCCFGDPEIPLGNINQHTGEDIWNGAGFRTIRKGILKDRYPKNLCHNCLNRKSYPQSHFLVNKVNLYAQWVDDCFGSEFSKRLFKRTKKLAKNLKTSGTS